MIGASLLLGGCFGDIGQDEPAAIDASTESPTDAEVPPPIPDAAQEFRACVEGDARVEGPDGSCYFLVYGGAEDAGTVSWPAARAACAASDAHLVSVTTLAEQTLVGDLASAAADTGTPVTNIRDDYWLGANDIATEGTFVWDNGEAFVFDAWRDGEPNNNGGVNIDENCAIQEGDLGTWDDRNCDALTYGYICERAPTLVTP